MKDKMSFWLICVLATAIIALSILTNKIKKERNYYKLVNDAASTMGMVENTEYLKNLYLNEGMHLNPKQQLLSYEDYSKLNMESLVTDGSKLILRMRETDCGACIDSTLAILRDNLEKINPANIVILTNHKVPRELVLYLRTNQLRLVSYRINRNIENLPGDKQTPYFFVLGKDLQITMFHEVNRKMPELTQFYLEKIGERFRNN